MTERKNTANIKFKPFPRGGKKQFTIDLPCKEMMEAYGVEYTIDWQALHKLNPQAILGIMRFGLQTRATNAGQRDAGQKIMDTMHDKIGVRSQRSKQVSKELLATLLIRHWANGPKSSLQDLGFIPEQDEMSEALEKVSMDEVKDFDDLDDMKETIVTYVAAEKGVAPDDEVKLAKIRSALYGEARKPAPLLRQARALADAHLTGPDPKVEAILAGGIDELLAD